MGKVYTNSHKVNGWGIGLEVHQTIKSNYKVNYDIGVTTLSAGLF